jgi:hypothetical protein
MRRTLVAGGVLLAIVAGFFVLRGDESRRVRARVEAAAEALSPPPGEPDIQRLTRLAGLAKLLARDVVVEADAGGVAVRGREAVAGVAAQVSAAAGPQRIALTDFDVTLDDTKTRATVTVVAHVTSTSPAAASRYDGQAIHLELLKDGGEWLISLARPQPALDR